MHRVLDVDPERRRVRMEPGAIHTRVQREAAPHGLRLGPDPLLGRLLHDRREHRNHAAGAHTLRHGATKDHLLALTVVLHEGTVVTLGEGADRTRPRPGPGPPGS